MLIITYLSPVNAIIYVFVWFMLAGRGIEKNVRIARPFIIYGIKHVLPELIEDFTDILHDTDVKIQLDP